MPRGSGCSAESTHVPQNGAFAPQDFLDDVCTAWQGSDPAHTRNIGSPLHARPSRVSGTSSPGHTSSPQVYGSQPTHTSSPGTHVPAIPASQPHSRRSPSMPAPVAHDAVGSVAGAADAFRSVRYPDIGHTYTPAMRAEMLAWLDRWLK